ncbi:MAG: alpha/beta fold hydrolase [Proteobacteria bacterium]|nr:alpha/beta fold hydrolase [Pseudomonadota bacterium]
MTAKGRWKLLKKLLFITAMLYVIVIVGFFALQEHLIFHPLKSNNGLLYYQELGKLKGVREVTIESYGGVKLQAWYRRPDPGYDMVLYLHGNSGNIEQRAGKIQLLADMGYGVLIPAWRGFGSSTGSPSKEGIYEDARAAVRFLMKQGYDSRKVTIVGESLGSGPAVKMATEKEFKGLLLITPYTSIADRGYETYPFLPINTLLKHNFDNMSNIKDVHVPIIIVHGTDDVIMPHWHSERLHKEANEPKKLIIYPGVGHSDYDTARIFQEMRSFLGMADNHKTPIYDRTMDEPIPATTSKDSGKNETRKSGKSIKQEPAKQDKPVTVESKDNAEVDPKTDPDPEPQPQAQPASQEN